MYKRQETTYSCGAFYLAAYESLETWVMKKNPENYDADNVFIDTTSRIYNAEASVNGPEMIKRGEIDEATIGSDILDSWLSDDTTKDCLLYTSVSACDVSGDEAHVGGGVVRGQDVLQSVHEVLCGDGGHDLAVAVHPVLLTQMERPGQGVGIPVPAGGQAFAHDALSLIHIL